jgi:glycerol uptake facilitator-like aquaporin
MSADPSRRLLAGAVGTGALVMLGAGSVVAALTVRSSSAALRERR